MKVQQSVLVASACLFGAFGLVACGGSDDDGGSKGFESALGQTDPRYKPILSSLPQIEAADPFGIASDLPEFVPGLKDITRKNEKGELEESFAFDLNEAGYAKSGKAKAQGKEKEIFKATYEADGKRLKTAAKFGSRLNDKGEPVPSTTTVFQTWDLTSTIPALKHSPIKVETKSENEEELTAIKCESATKCKLESKSKANGIESSYKLNYEFASPSILEVISKLAAEIGSIKVKIEPLFQKGLWSGSKTTTEFQLGKDGTETGTPLTTTSTETCAIVVGGKKTCSSVLTGGVNSTKKETSQMVISGADGVFEVEHLPLKVESVRQASDGQNLVSKSLMEYKYDAQWRLKSTAATSEFETSTTTTDDNGENPVTTKETVKRVETLEYSYVGESRRIAKIVRKGDGKLLSTTTYTYVN